MTQSADLGLPQPWRTVWRRRYIVLAATAAVGLATAAVNLAMPPLYSHQLLLMLPEADRYVMNDKYDRVRTTLFNVAETRALLERFPSDAPGIDRALLGKYRSIKIDQVRGSETCFRLVTVARDDPRAAPALSQAALAFLQHQPFLQDRIDRARSDAEALLGDIDQAIKRATKARDESQRSAQGRLAAAKDAIGAEIGIADLKVEYHRVRNAIDQLHSYQLVARPDEAGQPVRSRVLGSAIAMSLLGLCGSLAAVALSSREARLALRDQLFG